MVQGYWYRLCPTCEQGRLFVRVSPEARLYLLCEECFCAFDSPDEAHDGRNCKEGMGLKGALATSEDIERHGWAEYVFNVSESSE